MYHSINISGKNTYTEWGLIPTERPVVSPPQVKSTFVDLPSSNESIDYTEMLTGEVHYGQSTGSWSFYFDPEWPNGLTDANRALTYSGKLWTKVYSSLLNYVHGKQHQIVFEDEPNRIYIGRLSVSNWQSSKPFSVIMISYNINSEVGNVV